MLIFTDAGFKKGVSSHGFIVKHWDGRVILEKSFIGNETDSNESELMSIVNALNWLGAKRKGTKRRPRIYTDSLVIYEAVHGIGNHKIDVTYIQHMMKQVNAKLLWRKRNEERIQEVHNLVNLKLNSKLNKLSIRRSK